MQGADAAHWPGEPHGRLAGIYHLLMEMLGVVAGVILGALALLITYDVVARNITLPTVGWALEITEYGLTVGTFLAAPWVLYHGAHIRIDMLHRALPAKGAQALELIVNFLGLSISASFAYLTVVVAAEAYRLGSVQYKVLVVPEWWLLIPVAISFLLLCIEFARRLAFAWRSMRA
jgi:TRAP-type C4-dicarboxylate transport system permease small subunit